MHLHWPSVVCIAVQMSLYFAAETFDSLSNKEMDTYKTVSDWNMEWFEGESGPSWIYHKAHVPSTGKYQVCKRDPKEWKAAEPWKCRNDWKSVEKGKIFKTREYDQSHYDVRIIGIVTKSNRRIRSDIYPPFPARKSWLYRKWYRMSIHPVIDALILICLCTGVIVLIWGCCCNSTPMRPSQMLENKVSKRASTV